MLETELDPLHLTSDSGEIRKTYYSIGEVCSRTGLEPHVLRYWENEFPQLRPKKNRAGNRAYREKDIEIITYIKHLLYEEQYTIPGAKKRLAELRSSGGDTTVIPIITPTTTIEPTEPLPQTPASPDNLKENMVQQLRDVLKILKS